MTQTQALLLFFAEYILASLLLLVSYGRWRPLDTKREMTKREFLCTIAVACLLALIEILAMTVVYIVPLDIISKIIALGVVQITGTTLIYTLMGAAWIRRCQPYPRGSLLALTIILLYLLADIFMPYYAKYVIAIIGTITAYLIPQNHLKDTAETIK